MRSRVYTLPVEQTQWHIPGYGAETIFNWTYDEGRDKLLTLYEKGKDKQWNSNSRIDWNAQLDFDDPLGFPDEYTPLWGSDLWAKMDRKEKGVVKHHYESWRFSQFMHGEQGALICTAKIVQTVPDIDSKFYAATQVMDEARHVEVYSRYLHEKLQMAYPISPPLKTLLDQGISDARWDVTYLAMQVIIEGLALAAFNLIRDMAKEPLGQAINAYVMQDEARHVAFGRIALRDYYPHLTEKERDEREEFAVEACYLMRDRFLSEEVWERLGMDVKACIGHVLASPLMTEFRRKLFIRIVPTLKDIGLWGARIQKAFVDMGVLEFAETNLDDAIAHDEAVAIEFDRLRAARDAAVRQVIADA